jgi:hypothetical protein
VSSVSPSRRTNLPVVPNFVKPYSDHTAIEVKAKENISPFDIKSLKALAEEERLKRFICVSLEKRTRTIGCLTVLPYREFLDALWAGEYSK